MKIFVAFFCTLILTAGAFCQEDAGRIPSEGYVPDSKLAVQIAEAVLICLKLEGPFPFSLTGILLSFIEPLSTNGIPIVAISTFDTDYILVQEEFLGATQQRLGEAGHEIVDDRQGLAIVLVFFRLWSLEEK